MYESTSQEQVTRAIIDQEADQLTLGLTDSELAVLVRVNGTEAAYTAEEARELAKALKCTSAQRWDETAERAVAYLHDLADVADGEKETEEVHQRWQSKPLNP